MTRQMKNNTHYEELLGRDLFRASIHETSEFLNNKVVLVTGGGGSIGSEICRQIAECNPKMLLILDIYENNAYELEQELHFHHPELDIRVIIASVRNEKRIRDIFHSYQIDIVYHAAAHKHVPLMEDNPGEAIKNNVFGTYNTACAARDYHVKTFVLISTDKAVNPTSVMGASKRICEMIVHFLNKTAGTDFVTVRFGNVIGSNGSVLPLFERQIEAGGPVTVTSPEVVRYFMTISEAVSLVIEILVYAKEGEIFILDMGNPVNIYEMAKKMVSLKGFQPGVDIKIQFTGLRPGEKLFEEVHSKEEGYDRVLNEKIYIVPPITMKEQIFFNELTVLKAMAEEEDKDIKRQIRKIVPNYTY